MKELSELQEHIQTSMPELHRHYERKYGIPMMSRHELKLKSVLIYSYLHEKHFNSGLPDEVYEELLKQGIELLGLRDGMLTAVLHKLFRWHPYIRSHGIIHDAYGQFYSKYLKNKGYTYAISESKHIIQ